MSALEISIITETYNLDEGQSFEELRSSLKTIARYVQTRNDCEGILVDTAEDQRVPSLIAEIEPRIRHVRIPGLSYDHAKDEGAKAAKGNFVVYLDGDCTPESPDWLERFTTYLNRWGFRWVVVCDSRCWLDWRPACDGPTSFQ